MGYLIDTHVALWVLTGEPISDWDVGAIAPDRPFTFDVPDKP